jgi:hypothetical protein
MLQYLVCDYKAITKPSSDLGIAVAFAPIVRFLGSAIAHLLTAGYLQVFRGHASGMEAAIALSALGNIIAVGYTSTKGISLFSPLIGQ